MKNSLKYGKFLGVASVLMLGIAGCSGNNEANNGNDGVPASIESPVMDKKDDKAIAGGDNSNSTDGGATSGNSTAGGATSGNSTATGGAAGAHAGSGNKPAASGAH